MKIYVETFKKTNQTIGPHLASCWLGILLTWIFIEVFSFYFKHMEGLVGHTQHGMITVKLGLASVAMTKALVFMMLIPLRAKDLDLKRAPTGFWGFASRQVVPLTVEGLRVFAKVLLWMILFILPGIFKSIRYYFVPFVVMFDPRYEAGKLDALEESNRLMKPITWSFMILSLLLFVLDITLESLKSNFNILSQPHMALPLGLLAVLISVYTYAYMYRLYEVVFTKGEANESHV